MDFHANHAVRRYERPQPEQCAGVHEFDFFGRAGLRLGEGLVTQAVAELDFRTLFVHHQQPRAGEHFRVAHPFQSLEKSGGVVAGPAELHAAIAGYFAGIEGSFVDVAPLEAIEKSALLDPTRHNDTNRMTLHVFANDKRAQALLVAVYDNLGKGASGAAVQNLNLMLGVDAATSLAA